MKSHRLLIIGLDGFTWSVGQRLIDDGMMPTLQQLAAHGSYGNLTSVMPFETGPAWASFQTGCYPNNTGIFSFHTLDRLQNTVRLNSYNDIQAPTLWDIMAHHGKKVLTINMPLTSPPPTVNGVVIPGLLCPELSSDTIRPAWVYNKLIRPCRDYHIVNNKHCDSIQAFVNQSSIAENTRCRIALELMSQTEWDVAFVQIQSTDLMQHRYWWALDRDAKGHSEADYKIAAEFYNTCDSILARLIEQAGQDVGVLVLSDHGFTSQQFTLSLNRWLVERNYLVLKAPPPTRWQKAKQTYKPLKCLAGWYGNMRSALNQAARGIKAAWWHREQEPFTETELLHLRQCIDLDRSKAFCLGGMGAVIYINPDTCDPFLTANAIKQELINDFGPSSPIPLIKTIKTGLEEYGKSTTGVNLPDLVIQYAQGVSNIINPRSESVVNSYERRSHQPGTHARDGIYVFQGDTVRSNFHFNAQIVDILPTLLVYMGLMVPSHQDGSVLEKLFVRNPDIKYTDIPIKTSKNTQYSEAEQSEVEKRLADLGYL